MAGAPLFSFPSPPLLYTLLAVAGVLAVLLDLVTPSVPTVVFSFSFLSCCALYAYRPRAIYLVDFTCFKPPVGFRVPLAACIEHAHLHYPPDVADFCTRILRKSGLGDLTSLPYPIHYLPPQPSRKEAEEEAHLVVFSMLDRLFQRTKVKPREIDILVVNCNVYCPTPSLTAMVVNKYKMRSDIKTFNLSGMGCSAEFVALDIARHNLLVHANAYAVVVSTEIVTPSGYFGDERSMLVTNLLFRMGGAAVLLSNRAADRSRAKYQLVRLLRTHLGSDDRAYNVAQQRSDDKGFVGIALGKDLPLVAGEALKANIKTLAPLVLPISEQLRFVINLARRKLGKSRGLKPYIPDFHSAFEHFCVHAGGSVVIDSIQKNLRLTDRDVECARMTLYRFGNTSSSSPWYSLAYNEGKGWMKKGDRAWQIALGSGFMCNSTVWRSLRTVTEVDESWADTIDKLPVDVGKVVRNVVDQEMCPDRVSGAHERMGKGTDSLNRYL